MLIMKRLLILPLAILAPLTPNLAQANAAIIGEFRANAQVLPRKALAAGYRQFGAVDLSDLLSRMQSLDVRVRGKISHKQNIGGVFEAERDGAEWSHGAVSLSAARWPKLKADEKPMLALHEALGALKIEDTNFGCSGSIWALTDAQTRNTMNREEVATFESYAERGCMMARGGGSTGVTGGGDDYNVRIRMNIMRQGLAKMQAATAREGREQGFNDIAGSFYQSYGRKRNLSTKEFNRIFRSPNTFTFERQPYADTIRVYSNLDQTEEVPPGKRHGYTYDPRTRTVTINGRYRKTGPDSNGFTFGFRAEFDRE
ncbi:MAG: hypothetical protein EOP11_00660 [Proteobacteria bacterium]|nr:MAG: hypothetical protein EOP11_00660 [Pseudomonadota bacterium]